MSNIRVNYTGLISFVGGLLALVTGVIFSLILTRILSPEEYGSWGLIFSVVGYFLMIQPIFSYWTTREIARNMDSGKTAVLSNTVLSIISSGIFILISFFITAPTGVNYDLFLFATLLIPVTFLTGILTAINLGNKPHIISYSTIFFGLSQIPLALIFVYYLKMGILGVIITIILANIVSIFILFFYGREKIKNTFKKKYLQKWLKLSWISLYPSIYNILGGSTILIFTILSGSILGIAYWTASAILASTIAPAGLMSRAVYPKLLENKDISFFKDNISYLFYFGIFSTSLVIIFANPGLFALNPSFVIATPIVVLLAIEGFLVVLTNVFQQSLTGIEKVDAIDNSTAKDYLKSNLFHVHTMRLIQTVVYVVILVIGLILLISVNTSEIDLLMYWASVLLITQIPLVIYLSLKVTKHFKFPFDVKRILVFLIASIVMSISTTLLLDRFLIYSENIYYFLPNLLIFIMFSVGMYLMLTYVADSKIRQLFKLIVQEIIKKT